MQLWRPLAAGRPQAVLAALLVTLACGASLPLAGGLLLPLAIDFSGDGNATDQGGFGVYGASVEVTVWGTTGIAAGPLLTSAGPGGAYSWSFSQVTPTSLQNVTIRAWLPWDASVYGTAVFNVSNGTPQTTFPGVNLSMPFAAFESVDWLGPAGELVLPRGRTLNATFAFLNAGNVSVAHAGYALSASSANVTATILDAGPGVAEERPGASFGFNASFDAPLSAGVENASVSCAIASTSGAIFSFALPLRVVPNRDAAVSNLTTQPDPPDEARAGQILVTVSNEGLDLAPSVDVRVRAFNATVADLYANSTQVDIAALGAAVVSFEWVAPWSPDPVIVVATAFAAFDYDPADDSRSAAFAINATNEAPAVSYSTPAQGARLAGNVTVAGNAADPEGGAVAIAFAIDGGTPFLNATGPAFAFVWDLSALPDGPHSLLARATDPRGYTGAASLDIIVLNRGPNAAPTVSLAEPLEGDTVGASAVLRGAADDERGELASVFVSVDGGAEGAANGTTAWDFVWDAASAGEGPHQLRVRSFDGIDFSEASFVNVTVNLAAPSAVILTPLSLSPPTAIPGASVVLSGVATLDTGVLAAGAAVSAQVRQYPNVVSGVADARGRFSLTLAAPPAAGNYLVDAAATHAGVPGNATLALAVSTSTLPDLRLLPETFALSPDPPPPNTPIHHSLEIANNGSVSANATLRVWDGPRSSGTLIFEWRFAIAGSRQAGFDHAYAPGTHNLTFALEEVSPQDANTADNSIQVSVVVRDAPDFIIESIAPSSPSIVAGSNMTFLVVVRNAASTGGLAQVEVWDGVPAAANSSLIRRETVAVAGGARERVVAVWTPTAGEHRIFAAAVFAVPEELDLTNNILNITVSVAAPDGAGRPPLLPGLGGAMVAGAMATSALLARSVAVRRRRRPRGAQGAVVALLVSAALAAAFLPAPGAASLEDAGRVPGPLAGVCQSCHVSADGGGPLNPFGEDFEAERNASGGNVNWTRLGALDSDGDGYSNANEWADSYLPGDPASNPGTGVKYRGFTGAGVTSLLTGVLAVLVVSAAGVWSGFYMLNKRNARRARNDSKPSEAAAGGPAREPPAPKP